MPKMLFPLLLVGAPAALAAQTPPPQPTQTIVVTGTRLQDYRDRLAACLARNCPPDEDIDATLALAEAHLVNGDYRDARRALRSSLSRNRQHVRAYPEPLSDLNRANARVARHLGLDRDAEYSTWEILRALRAGLPTEDHRHFTARLEISQSLAQFGYRYHDSQRQLRRLIDLARAAGRDDVVAMAELRILWLDYLQSAYRSPPSAALLEMARSPDPRRSVGARMQLVRIYHRRGDRRSAEAVMAELGRSGQRRQLLHSPPYQLAQQESGAPMGAVNRVAAPALQPAGAPTRGISLTSNLVDQLTDNFEDKWVEVGFWVSPEGNVEGLEVLRHRNGAGWARPLIESIRGRRYAAADGRTYRLERYTYTSAYREGIGTRIARRSPQARVVFLDLSEGAEPPSPPTP
jgi:hypothetical protein